jgi:hypothetical protein
MNSAAAMRDSDHHTSRWVHKSAFNPAQHLCERSGASFLISRTSITSRNRGLDRPCDSEALRTDDCQQPIWQTGRERRPKLPGLPKNAHAETAGE